MIILTIYTNSVKLIIPQHRTTVGVSSLLSQCSLRRVWLLAGTHAIQFMCAVYHLRKIIAYPLLVLLYISHKVKFLLGGFSLKIIYRKFKNIINCKILLKNALLITFFKETITYHYLIMTYFHVCPFKLYLFEASLNLLANTSTILLGRTSLPAPLIVGPLILSREK